MLALLFTFLLADTSVAQRAAAAPVVIAYAAPSEGTPADADYRFTELTKGQLAFTVVNGTPVTVLEPLGRARLGGRVNQNYLVVHEDGRQARVFGGDLTPVRIEAFTLSFGGDFQIHVRDTRNGAEVVLPPAGGAYLGQKGGNASMQLDHGMLRVDSRPEACADWSETYVTFADGRLQVALVLNGLSDPPVHSTPTVKFKGDEATVTTENSEEDERGKVHRTRKVQRYRLEDGVFKAMSGTRPDRRAPPR